MISTARAYAIIALVVALLCGLQVAQAISIGQAVSLIADGYSEADAIRSGQGYCRDGFLANVGLPNVAFGDAFPDKGSKKDLWGPFRNRFIYTHYPPLPNLMAGAVMKVVGTDDVVALRFWPIAVTAICIGLFGLLLVRKLGPSNALIAFLPLAALPMFSNMMHGLHYQGYAMALLFLQVGLTLAALSADLPPSRRLIVAVGFLGLVQGWLSFDFVFLVSLAGVPLALVERPLRRQGARLPLLALLAAPALGFTLACVAHYLQVAAFYGSFAEATRDFFSTATSRLHTEKSGLWQLIGTYMDVLAAPKYAAIDVWWLVGAAGVLAVTTRRVRLGGRTPAGTTIIWDGHEGYPLAFASAFAISFLWIGVMRDHAANHLHFIPRHLLFFLFVCLYLVARGLRFEKGDGSAAGATA